MFELYILLLLFTKHLIVDFFWQPPYEWQNKGTYGHGGGIRHSIKHIIVTYLILMIFPFFIDPLVFPTFYFFIVVPAICVLEFVIHYHMDWFKMWYGKRKGWTPDTTQFWKLLGVDQFVHSITYIGIVAILWINI